MQWKVNDNVNRAMFAAPKAPRKFFGFALDILGKSDPPPRLLIFWKFSDPPLIRTPRLLESKE